MATIAAPTGLKRDALGLTSVVYQGITHIAPAANVLFSWAALAVVWIFTYRGITISSRAAAILGTLELLIMTALGLSFLLHPAHGSSFVAPFDPRSAPTGLQGIVLGMVFSILALSGFEAAAPLAEETRKPTQFIYRAIMWSLFAVGVLYFFSTSSTAVGFG